MKSKQKIKVSPLYFVCSLQKYCSYLSYFTRKHFFQMKNFLWKSHSVGLRHPSIPPTTSSHLFFFNLIHTTGWKIGWGMGRILGGNITYGVIFYSPLRCFLTHYEFDILWNPWTQLFGFENWFQFLVKNISLFTSHISWWEGNNSCSYWVIIFLEFFCIRWSLCLNHWTFLTLRKIQFFFQ